MWAEMKNPTRTRQVRRNLMHKEATKRRLAQDMPDSMRILLSIVPSSSESRLPSSVSEVAFGRAFANRPMSNRGP